MTDQQPVDVELELAVDVDLDDLLPVTLPVPLSEAGAVAFKASALGVWVRKPSGDAVLVPRGGVRVPDLELLP